jgi:hypothetical protein
MKTMLIIALLGLVVLQRDFAARGSEPPRPGRAWALRLQVSRDLVTWTDAVTVRGDLNSVSPMVFVRAQVDWSPDGR